MSEITSISSTSTTGRTRLGTKVDLTPMVDLGFLLITFFMLTTALNKPNVMALVMPDRTPVREPSIIAEKKVLTLILGDHDKIYWYKGMSDARLDSTDYASEGVQKVILDCMEQLEQQVGIETYEDPKTHEIKQGSLLSVLIKPMQVSRYKNVVDILDEMAICHVRRYMILPVAPQEEAFIKNPAAGLLFDIQMQESALFK